MSNIPFLKLDPMDTVAVALAAAPSGSNICVGSTQLMLNSAVERGHKIALGAIAKGDPIIRFGHRIGTATADIGPGEHVHVHNLRTALQSGSRYTYTPTETATPGTAISGDGFHGYRRTDHRVGTRNEIWVLNTVGCVNRTVTRIAERGQLLAEKWEHVDGVYAFPHPFGCSQLGDDLDQTRAVLRGLATHPNAGGVLIVGLGCENNRLESLLEGIPTHIRERIISFNAQQVGDEEEEGLKALCQLAERMADDCRVPCPVRDLVIGMKCGGSDVFSGLTANPLVGRITDRLTGEGGISLLTEVPEMFGAEHLLMNRAADEAVFSRIVSMIEAFKDYFVSNNQPVYENPSPGNKDGGITTLEEKSLGAIQKSGHARIPDVLGYGEPARLPGLSLINGPGNDAVSSTALTVSGATLLLFTTGRGTPLGFPAPTLKISSNSDLARQKPRWIDFDAGPIASGDTTIDAHAEELWRLILKTASGAPTRNEETHNREIAMWKTGVTL